MKEYIKEKEINFEPTYKYVKGSNEYAYDEDKIRVPAWTDRIFYCKNKNIKMLTYDTIKSIRYSDHRPVVGTFLINCANKIVDNKIKSSKDNFKNNLIYPEKQIHTERKYKSNKDNINNMDNIKKNNSSQNKIKNNQQIKMNYRGINFNTEIEITDFNRKYNEKEKQNIYDFFTDKKSNKNINSNLIFNSFNYE